MAKVYRLDPYQNIVNVGWRSGTILHAEFHGGDMGIGDGSETFRSGDFDNFGPFPGGGSTDGPLFGAVFVENLYIQQAFNGEFGTTAWTGRLETIGDAAPQPFRLDIEGGPSLFSSDAQSPHPGQTFFTWLTVPHSHLSEGPHRVALVPL